MPKDPEPAWTEICRLYEFTGVSPLCLSLQDRFDVDVCLLLILALADDRGQTCSDDALRSLVDRAAVWRDVAVKPLRAVRIATKQITPTETTFREAVKRCELAAEAVHVVRLAADLATAEVGDGTLVKRYLAGCKVDPPLRQAAISLLRSASTRDGSQPTFIRSK